MKLTEKRTDRLPKERAGKQRFDLSKYDDHFPDPDWFNAAISEVSGSSDEDVFDEDFDLDEDDDHQDPFETLPEWDIIEHNLGI
jgi:hypothetical protein